MLGFFTTKEFWASITTGLFTIAAVWVTVTLSLRYLRDTEVSRLRIKCVTELISFRFALLPGSSASKEAEMPFLSALNAVPGLFGSNENVMQLFRDYREVSLQQKNAVLCNLIRAAAEISKIPLPSVSNVDLETPFSRSSG